VTQTRKYSTTWRVRSYELDSNAHVNNSVYVAYAEDLATQHAESLGFGREFTLARGALWVARRHEITYLRPAGYGDVLELTTEVEEMRGARAIRHTTIRLAADGAPVVDMRTEWVWLRAATGRPERIPAEIMAAFLD
jgi:acyl-CoA thioester hydrolase